MVSLAKGDTLGAKIVLAELYKEAGGDRHELAKITIQKGVNLPEIANLIGIPPTMSLIAIMIENFCSQFNFGPGKNMNRRQMEDLAADIVLDFTNRKGNQVRLEEMAVFFDRASKGEFTKPGGKSFIFDRIDRAVIEEIMDHYFENDRTKAIHAIEDEKNASRIPADQIIHPRETPPIQLDKSGKDITPKNIYDLAGTGRFGTVKALKELEKKYGGTDGEK